MPHTFLLTNEECCTLNYVCSRRSFFWQRLQVSQKGSTKGTCTVGKQTAAVSGIWHRIKVKVCSAGDYCNSEGCVDWSWFVQHWWWVEHVERYDWIYWLGKKCIYVRTYTGCPRRNVPDFGRMFLMIKYTDITQNTYIQSWTVTEIMAREVWKYDSSYTLIHYQIHIKNGRNMWFL